MSLAVMENAHASMHMAHPEDDRHHPMANAVENVGQCDPDVIAQDGPEDVLGEAPQQITSSGIRSGSWRASPMKAIVLALISFLGSLALSVALSMAFVPSASAQSAGWQGFYGGEAILGFGDTYISEMGRSSTHSGVDVSASSGSSVTAPVGGTVTFSGSIPTGEIPGSPTTLAVSIDIGDGFILTLMPFDSVKVSEGDAVSAGQALGLLAATGDVSSSSPHVHVSLRENGKYVDPSWLLGIESTAASSADDSSGASVGADGVSTASSGAGASIPAPEEAYAPQSSALGASEDLQAEGTADSALEVGTITSKVDSAEAVAIVGQEPVSTEESSGLLSELGTLVSRVGSLIGDLGSAGFAVLALVPLTGICLLWWRRAENRDERAMDGEKASILKPAADEMENGGNILGLLSCPGRDQGRLVQRR